MNARRALAVALVALGAVFTAQGHEGHDHGAPPPALTAATLAPRASAATDAFEVVVALEGAEFVVTIDRFDTNEPVVRAKVDVDAGAVKGSATERTPGVYTIGAGAVGPGTRVPMSITIDTDTMADLIAVTLAIPAAVAAPVAVSTVDAAIRDRNRSIGAGAVGLAIVVASLALVLRARRRKEPDVR